MLALMSNKGTSRANVNRGCIKALWGGIPGQHQKGYVMRPSGRKLDEMRAVSIETGFTKHAEGSVLIEMGETRVLCTASVEEGVPRFLKGKNFDGDVVLVSSFDDKILSNVANIGEMHKLNIRGQIRKPLTKKALDAAFVSTHRETTKQGNVSVDCEPNDNSIRFEWDIGEGIAETFLIYGNDVLFQQVAEGGLRLLSKGFLL